MWIVVVLIILNYRHHAHTIVCATRTTALIATALIATARTTALTPLPRTQVHCPGRRLGAGHRGRRRV